MYILCLLSRLSHFWLYHFQSEPTYTLTYVYVAMDGMQCTYVTQKHSQLSTGNSEKLVMGWG